MAYDLFTSEEFYEEQPSTETFYEARNWVEELLHSIYVTGDCDRMEDSLDELCSILGLKLPESEPKLIKRAPDMFEIAQQLLKLKKESF